VSCAAQGQRAWVGAEAGGGRAGQEPNVDLPLGNPAVKTPLPKPGADLPLEKSVVEGPKEQPSADLPLAKPGVDLALGRGWRRRRRRKTSW
jgi:hypothetical protein